MAQENATQEQPEFRMLKMYVKDLSFENPLAPQVFSQPRKSEAKIELNLDLKNRKIDDSHYEVSLHILTKLVADDAEKPLFVIEVEHAALFLMKNIPTEHFEAIIAVDCPTLLFPFTRQIICQAVMDGGFQPFLMEPINFLAMYQNSKAKRQ
ncbi:MAG: protein-export chaperone SecB [Desulfobulbaceae bacterium]|jgi:preprotein translocase subunit SecB|nr:protein-export chaperone SecB [Desulfobulbaceae bacterium]